MGETLKRTISLWGAVAFVVGMVVGASIFVVIPSLAGMTGPSLFIAYAVSVVPAIFTGLYLVQLSGAMPVTAANYIAVTRWISPMAGFTISIATIVAMISSNCMVAWGFGEYMRVYFPSVSSLACAVGILLFFGFINWIGVKIFEWIQIAMFVALIAGMLIFGIGGLFNIQPGYHAQLFPNGIGKFVIVMAIATFSWGGIVAITEIAGDVKNPKRNVPLAIIFAIIIIMIIYVLQTFVFTGTMLWSEAAGIGPTAVLVAAGRFLPPWLVAFVFIAALLAMATTINAMTFMAAREMLAWSRDHLLPLFFSRLNLRFQTPEYTILVMTGLSVIGVLFAATLDKYALLVVFALMVIQSFGATAVLLMPTRAPDIYAKSLFRFSPFWRWFTWTGCIVLFSLMFLFGLLADLKTGVVFIAILLLSLAYWHIRKSYLKRQGRSLEQEMRSFGGHVTSEIEME